MWVLASALLQHLYRKTYHKQAIISLSSNPLQNCNFYFLNHLHLDSTAGSQKKNTGKLLTSTYTITTLNLQSEGVGNDRQWAEAVLGAEWGLYFCSSLPTAVSGMLYYSSVSLLPSSAGGTQLCRTELREWPWGVTAVPKTPFREEEASTKALSQPGKGNGKLVY